MLSFVTTSEMEIRAMMVVGYRLARCEFTMEGSDPGDTAVDIVCLTDSVIFIRAPMARQQPEEQSALRPRDQARQRPMVDSSHYPVGNCDQPHEQSTSFVRFCIIYNF